MEDDPKRTEQESANKDGLAAVAIMLLALALIIFVAVKLY